MSPTVIDAHAHVIPMPFLETAARDNRYSVTVEHNKAGQIWLRHGEGYRYPVTRDFFDAEARLEALDRAQVDGAVLSPSPTLFYYASDPSFAAEAARLINDGLAEMVQGRSSRLQGLGVVPLQDPPAAIREMERCLRELGFGGVHVGCTLGKASVFEPEREVFFRRAAELGALVFVHPSYVGLRPGLEKYYLTNTVGNPFETTVAIGHAIFSGLLDRCPNLRLLFAHGGGFLPYQIGRFDHAYRVRPEARERAENAPSSYFRKLYYDTITHNVGALSYLVESVGYGQVMLGSDAPFDMADPEPVRAVLGADFPPRQRDAILGENAKAILGWSDVRRGCSR